MKSVFLVVALLVAAPLAAQSPTPAIVDAVNEMVLAPGAAATAQPIVSLITNIGATSPLCNLTPFIGPLATANPKFYEFDDPFHVGKACRVPVPTTIPVGSGYTLVSTLMARSISSCVDAAGTTISPCESPRSVAIGPFDVTPLWTVPARPSGGKLLP